MKKLIIAGLMVFVILLSACTGLPSKDVTSIDEDEYQTVNTDDGLFSISMPDTWIKDYSYSDEEMEEKGMVLAYTDNDITFINVYFYNSEYYDYTLNDSLDFNLDYFGENIIGEYEKMSLNDMDVLFFENSMVDENVDGDAEYNYHGYMYMINTPYGVVEIDIYYSQEVLESKIFKPSEEQLVFLQKIAESFEVN